MKTDPPVGGLTSYCITQLRAYRYTQTMMKRLAAFTFTALVATVAGKQGDGTDLPPDSMLRIGVKKRVPDSECP